MMSKKLFKRYFEWIGETIYIRVRGRDTTTKLDELFEWFEENKYDLTGYYTPKTLRDELHGLWAKHNRLMDYLGLEEVTTPQIKVIRKLPSPTKRTKVVAQTKLKDS